MSIFTLSRTCNTFSIFMRKGRRLFLEDGWSLFYVKFAIRLLFVEDNREG